MSSSQPSTGDSATAAGVESPAVNPERKARKEAQKALKAQQAAEKKAAKQAQPTPSSSSSNKPKESNRRPQSSSEQLSRALAYILRHGADKEGLSMRPDGYIALDDVLDRPRVKSVNMADSPGQKRRPALKDIQQIVDTNDKKRFELLFDETWLVRAVQGHSLSQVVELSHTPLTLTNLHLLKLQDDDDDNNDDLAEQIDVKLGLQEGKVEVVHGTFTDAWDKILASGGLRRMSRNHIHLAKGRFGQKGVVSGMRKSANRLIFVDVRRAIADGFEFALSSNGVVLTPGKGEQGVLPIEYFTRVEDAKGNIVWTPPSSSQP